VKMLFLLVVVIEGSDADSDPRMLFESAFDCNRYALYTERQATSQDRMNTEPQKNITAYCKPVVRSENTPAIKGSRSLTQ